MEKEKSVLEQLEELLVQYDEVAEALAIVREQIAEIEATEPYSSLVEERGVLIKEEKALKELMSELVPALRVLSGDKAQVHPRVKTTKGVKYTYGEQEAVNWVITKGQEFWGALKLSVKDFNKLLKTIKPEFVKAEPTYSVSISDKE